MSARIAIFAAGILLACAVAAGAYGAHAMRTMLAPDMAAVYVNAVQYHFWHALGLLGVGALLVQKPGDRPLAISAWLLLVGMVLFCGGLYTVALTGNRSFGMIAPVGGTALIAAWIALAWAAWNWPRERVG